MKQITFEWALKHVREALGSECPNVFYAICDKIEVNTGDLPDCNLKYCKDNNIPVYPIIRRGGTIVTCDGTIAFGLVNSLSSGFQSSKFSNEFINFLKSKEITAKIDHNDILIDGYKVASTVENIVPIDKTKVYSLYLISYDVDIEAIRNICLKEMKKEPKGLKEFGIDKQELIDWLMSYFNNLEKNLK